jgi:proteasome lid subunit RPN8/RPN11
MTKQLHGRYGQILHAHFGQLGHALMHETDCQNGSSIRASDLTPCVVREDGPCPFCHYPPSANAKRPLLVAKDMLVYLEHVRDKKQEFIVCLSLDSKQQLIARRIVTMGLVNVSIIHPREVFAGPLSDRACSVVVAHNHPSGILTPSEDDIEITRQLIAAGEILGMPLHDHIILTKDDYYSFKANGLIV